MASSPSPKARISERLLRYRWLIMALAGLIFITFEVTEHLLSGGRLSTDFVSEILIFGMAIPLIGGLVLTLLARTEADRVRAVRHIDLQNKLSQQVAEAQDWDELAATLVGFPRTVVPLVGASLLVYRQDRARFELAAEWRDPDGKASVSPTSFLHPSSSTDLMTALLAQAKSVGHQANFQAELTSEGQSRALSSLTQHQVLYLFREVLTNVAKHAQARHVGINLIEKLNKGRTIFLEAQAHRYLQKSCKSVKSGVLSTPPSFQEDEFERPLVRCLSSFCITWTADALTIKLSDDGRGFDPDATEPNGHFGLTIMQDRAREIHGRFRLASHPDVGTEVTLRLPLS